jgi:hypothetical protein
MSVPTIEDVPNVLHLSISISMEHPTLNIDKGRHEKRKCKRMLRQNDHVRERREDDNATGREDERTRGREDERTRGREDERTTMRGDENTKG